MSYDFLIIQLLIAAYLQHFSRPSHEHNSRGENLWSGRFCPLHSRFPVLLGVTIILQDGSAQFQGIVCCYILPFRSYQNPVSRKREALRGGAWTIATLITKHQNSSRLKRHA